MGWAQLAGGILNQVGGYYKAWNIREAGRQTRKLMFQQAGMIEAQAAQLRQSGLERMHDMLRAEGRDVSSSRALAGKAGVRVGTGSALETEQKISREHTRDRLLFGREVADIADNLYAEAALVRKAGKLIEKQARRAGISSMLSTATSSFSMMGSK